MKTDEIKLLYDYNEWADARILAACARVRPEQYAAPTSYWRGGLRTIMVHILDNLWQQRITLQGYYQEPLADEAAYDATELHEDAFPTLAVLRERSRIEQQEMRAYLDRLTEETLNGTIRYVIPGARREGACRVAHPAGGHHPCHATPQRGRRVADRVWSVVGRLRLLTIP